MRELGVRLVSCDGKASLLFTENETNTERLVHVPQQAPYVKDGINNYIVCPRPDRIR